MVTAVIDTSALVSALVSRGKPRRLVTKPLEDHLTVSSREMLAELADAISRDKFRALKTREAERFLSILATRAVLVTIRHPPKTVAEDPDDDMVLAIAHEGKADCIVSGDKHLLKLQEFRGIRIVTVGKMPEAIRRKTN
jgi:putative PIN family toxin of toxin-antitoxin system